MRKKNQHPDALAATRRAVALVRNETSDELKQVLQLVKETDARSRVLFTKIHNLQVEIEAERKAYDKLLAVLSELWQRPDQLTPSEHIIKDFLRDKYK